MSPSRNPRMLETKKGLTDSLNPRVPAVLMKELKTRVSENDLPKVKLMDYGKSEI